jgi:hypothetical protein
VRHRTLGQLHHAKTLAFASECVIDAMETHIEGYYHSALEACAQASQLETENRRDDALTEYRRSIALIETMRQLSNNSGSETDQAYFAGVCDVEGLCRVHIAKLEGELPTLGYDRPQVESRRVSSDNVNKFSSSGLTRVGSVPSRKEPGNFEKRKGPTERPKTSRTPSPEKKEKKSMPFTLRQLAGSPSVSKMNATDATASASTSLAVEASRAATLAWQGKRPDPSPEIRRTLRNPSPSSIRPSSSSTQNSYPKRSSIPDSSSLLDAPLIDFSDFAADATSSTHEYLNQTYAPLSPVPTPPSHSPQPDTLPSTRWKSAPKRQLGRSNIKTSRPLRATKSEISPHSSWEAQEETFEPHSQIPISVSISSEISDEQELSREELVLKDLKGVDETLARIILNDIVVRGDEVQWDDIGLSIPDRHAYLQRD